MSKLLQRALGVAFIAALLACSRDGQAATGPEAPRAASSTPLFKEASAQTAAQPDAAVPAQTSLAPLIERLKPMVVNISTNTVVKHPALGGNRRGNRGAPNGGGNRRGNRGAPNGGGDEFQQYFDRFFGRGQGPGGPGEAPPELRGSSLGSGFLLNGDGFILTNNHVVKDSTDITVRLTDGREFRATKVGTDAVTDVALIKLNNPPKDLPSVTLGDSDAIRQGDFVLALGSPFGLNDTATLGIISAKHREGVSPGNIFDDFLQTDAAINQGNSGGPLFNLKGEVVGINTAIVSPQLGQGIGFAVPINIAKALLPQLKEKGKVSRGFMGVAVQAMVPDLAQAFGLPPTQKGALVESVVPNKPAAKAGIEPGDIILSVNGKDVDSSGALTRTVSLIQPGGKAEVVILRNGARKTITMTVEARPNDEVAAGAPDDEGGGAEEQGNKSPKLGLSLSPITPELAKESGLSPGAGVLVLKVVEGGPAERAGIRDGDVILEVNRKPVKQPAEVAKIVGAMKDGEFALLRVRRGDSSAFFPVPVGGRQ